MTDMLGREFVVGQYVAYGGRAGSRGYMAVGRVYKLTGDSVSVKPVARSAGRWSANGDTDWADIDEKARGLQQPWRAVILDSAFQIPE